MKKIDVTKCEYYDDYYKTCSNFSIYSDDEPYCNPANLLCSYYVRNIEKQLQQLKQENEELKQKLEKIKRLCTNKEEARLLYDCKDFDFYEIVKIIESEN